MVDRGPDGYYHPGNEDELRSLIRRANAERLKLRVRGAGHSERGAIYAQGVRVSESGPNINVLLDKMASVEMDPSKMQVTAGAGCHLGYDPEDPSGMSTRANSLFQQLDRAGWALPDMGGITRQTVGGFLSTGSAGGSVRHSPGDLIVKIRVMDGNGEVHELTKTADLDDRFYAAGVSMGLLGVVTAVTLQCVSRYNVEGSERTSSYADCQVDLFGPGSGPQRPSLERFLTDTEHSRLLLWPQRGVEKVTVWQAHKVEARQGFEPVQYRQVRGFLGSTYPAYLAIGLAFRFLDPLNPPGSRGWFAHRSERLLGLVYKLIAGQFLRPESPAFRDAWWRGLPMDDQTNYRLLPTGFTEIWLSLSRTEEVMQRLLKHYRDGGYPATGIYACELYASPSSEFWMSPAYGRPVLRVDMFWFNKSKSDPLRDFYPQFWDLFRDMEYTLHWGKALAPDAAHLRQRYPRWQDFMRVRAEMDPNGIFLTDYWRTHLGL